MFIIIYYIGFKLKFYCHTFEYACSGSVVNIASIVIHNQMNPEKPV